MDSMPHLFRKNTHKNSLMPFTNWCYGCGCSMLCAITLGSSCISCLSCSMCVCVGMCVNEVRWLCPVCYACMCGVCGMDCTKKSIWLICDDKIAFSTITRPWNWYIQRHGMRWHFSHTVCSGWSTKHTEKKRKKEKRIRRRWKKRNENISMWLVFNTPAKMNEGKLWCLVL